MIALVTGANRGIGREVARQLAVAGHTVFLTARSAEAAAAAARAAGPDAHPLRLDVTYDTWQRATDADLDVVREAAETNLYGPWRLTQALLPLLRARACPADQVGGKYRRLISAGERGLVRPAARRRRASTRWGSPLLERSRELGGVGNRRQRRWGHPLLEELGGGRARPRVSGMIRRTGPSAHPRVVNVSSEVASLTSMGGGTPAYTSTKAALNALTRMLAAELRPDRVLVNAVCPGWVATDMGGPGGRPVAEGAASVVWAATLPDDGPTGGFFRDGQPLPW
ncbi:short-chain dehydrogenase [Streptomyces mirabilis]|uniref:SDR family NAD(P)-dependent oxidoreductase n=1 Tax=Streptomyces mirabilis TaxID=68239 RepID=UPI0019B0946F|nr:SDR family NAD(P)-dependent oxidoreductase [Streptomyces mirabilis]GHD57663.1 short-chain dehydrogenase [Streptomyces mirabilis]